LTSSELAALAYSQRGLKVFPCLPDKRPLTHRGFREATTDPHQVSEWWRRWPHALVGFWPGASGVAVLDVDRKHGVDGLATLARLLGPRATPRTPTVVTPSGGIHLHFRMPERRIGVTQGARGAGIGDGLDWRGDSGYAMLPCPSGGYTWSEDGPEGCPLAEVPEALMPGRGTQDEFSGDTGAGLEGPPDRVPSASSLAAAARLASEAKPGERNSLLFWASCRLAEGVSSGLIKGSTAWEVLLWAGKECGLSQQEAQRTIRSAFASAPSQAGKPGHG
jgi:hypothetical protein